MPLNKKSKRMDQAEINALISNWNWETQSTPHWLKNMITILIRIDDHNITHHNTNLTPLSFNIRQRLIELSELS